MLLLKSPQLTKTLNETTIQLNRYFSLFIFFFGVIGNVLNILALKQRPLRSNPCIFLFILSSIANLISILFGLTPRILSSWDLDITATHDIPCKLRAFITFSSRTAALWFIMLATIDRWIKSSNNIRHRRFSSLKNAHTAGILITILSILLYCQMFYCYKSDLVHTPLRCYSKTISCSFLTDFSYACLTILFPLMAMMIFGLMTIVNVRQTRAFLDARRSTKKRRFTRDISMFLTRRKQRWKRLDRYLLRMLLLQVILLILLTVPQAIHKLYLTLTSNRYKSPLEHDIERFLYNFELLLPFLESALPFYIYTLTGGQTFRDAVEKVTSSLTQRLFGKRPCCCRFC